MTKIISILNQKGGVGKTTSTYNISAVLASKGQRVLMIDCDSQASLTLMTGNDPQAIDGSIVDVLENNKAISDCIYELPIENLHLTSSRLELAQTELSLMRIEHRERRLKLALGDVKEQYDYIIIDCPPALGLLTINALIASNYVIAPCETSAISAYALDDLSNTINDIQEINETLAFLGVIATRFNKVAKADQACLNELVTNYNVLGIVKNSVAAKDGIDEGIPAVTKNKKTDVAKAYIEITEKIMEVV